MISKIDFMLCYQFMLFWNNFIIVFFDLIQLTICFRQINLVGLIISSFIIKSLICIYRYSMIYVDLICCGINKNLLSLLRITSFLLSELFQTRPFPQVFSTFKHFYTFKIHWSHSKYRMTWKNIKNLFVKLILFKKLDINAAAS